MLRTLRQTDRETRVLILSARSEVADKVEGLDAGANDYLAKPFHLEELEARIRSLTLRQFIQNDVVSLTAARCRFDTQTPAPPRLTARHLALHAKGDRHSGVPAAQSGAARQSGGAVGPCLGQQRGQFQQLHPGTHFRSAEKAAGGAGL